MSEQVNAIRIYVACLAAYNNGVLHGRWIDADQDERAIWEEIRAMLEASPVPNAEEYAIHDYEGFEVVSICEYESIESVCEIAAFISQHGALGGALIEYFGDTKAAAEAIQHHYAGEYRSVADFAENITEEITEIPESLRYYIHYEKMARDMAINDILTVETGFEEVHIFWRH